MILILNVIVRVYLLSSPFLSLYIYYNKDYTAISFVVSFYLHLVVCEMAEDNIHTNQFSFIYITLNHINSCLLYVVG